MEAGVGRPLSGLEKGTRRFCSRSKSAGLRRRSLRLQGEDTVFEALFFYARGGPLEARRSYWTNRELAGAGWIAPDYIGSPKGRSFWVLWGPWAFTSPFG